MCASKEIRSLVTRKQPRKGVFSSSVGAATFGHWGSTSSSYVAYQIFSNMMLQCVKIVLRKIVIEKAVI